MAVIHKGEDKTITVTLKQDGLPKDITGHTVKAQLRDKKTTKTANGAEITCSESAAGADFSAGIIKVIYTDTQTAALTTGKAYELEIHTEDGSGNKLKAVAGEDFEVIDSVIA